MVKNKLNSFKIGILKNKTFSIIGFSPSNIEFLYQSNWVSSCTISNYWCVPFCSSSKTTNNGNHLELWSTATFDNTKKLERKKGRKTSRRSTSIHERSRETSHMSFRYWPDEFKCLLSSHDMSFNEIKDMINLSKYWFQLEIIT